MHIHNSSHCKKFQPTRTNDQLPLNPPPPPLAEYSNDHHTQSARILEPPHLKIAICRRLTSLV
ncbi:hypothetical protein BVRB_7g169300 [Beta vulgaris subsp. vulgaris]|nr:hypothetical protein BVRB_7g169300 [Beta vulgaris subsp. vulgaris]